MAYVVYAFQSSWLLELLSSGVFQLREEWDRCVEGCRMPPSSKSAVCRLLTATEIDCWEGRSSPAGARSGAASMPVECLTHFSEWSPSGDPKMGLGAFPSSATTAGIGSAESGDLLCSHGLGEASRAAIKPRWQLLGKDFPPHLRPLVLITKASQGQRREVLMSGSSKRNFSAFGRTG